MKTREKIVYSFCIVGIILFAIFISVRIEENFRSRVFVGSVSDFSPLWISSNYEKYNIVIIDSEGNDVLFTIPSGVMNVREYGKVNEIRGMDIGDKVKVFYRYLGGNEIYNFEILESRGGTKK